MQRLQGDGLAFVHAGGTLDGAHARTRARSCASTPAASSPSSPRSTTTSSSWAAIKSALFGGEGLFFATLRGPGKVWLQSLPLSRLADRIYAAAPQAGGRGREEGSILGGLGRILDGDR